MINAELSNDIHFEALKHIHLPLIQLWMEKQHIRKWWDPELSWEEIQKKILARISSSSVHQYLAYSNSVPIGFIQFEHLERSAELDLYIADCNYLHKGYGKKMIQSFLRILQNHGIYQVLVDPHQDNIRAINFYKSIGFHQQKDKSNNSFVQLSLSISN